MSDRGLFIASLVVGSSILTASHNYFLGSVLMSLLALILLGHHDRPILPYRLPVWPRAGVVGAAYGGVVKPLALDLCCGKGGWTIGLQSAGWEVIGVDVEAWPGYPGDRHIIADVRTLKGSDFPGVKLVCASPPCQEFSYKSFPFKRCKEAPDPDQSIWRACERIAKEIGCPLILENVSGARKYMGAAKAHYGSFYLWGDVPPLLPIGNPRKGFGKVEGKKDSFHGKGRFAGEMDRVKPVYKRMVGSEKYREFQRGETQKTSSGSNSRKEWSAMVAMIPPELSQWIGECFHP